MNKNLTALSPALVWKHFAAICQVPHPSHHEELIRKYVVEFAAEHSLYCHVDAGNNIYIRKEATPGMENKKGIILQAHLDMVPQKNNDKVFNFETDPIEAYIDGDWVTANGTSLGADNGIGAAAILAVLEDTTICHGPIEALFTATEETGMDGAFSLERNMLQGEIMLNLDSETEGELYVGCAGGMDASITLPYEEVPAPTGYKPYLLEVKGLNGGHSGIQISSQFANANRKLFRLLLTSPVEVLLASVDGGGLRNAIPREATAVVLVKEQDAETFEQSIKMFEKILIAEYANIENGVSVTATPTEMPKAIIPADVSSRLARAVVGAPNGVVKMSVAMEGLVQTSSNLARVVSNGSEVKVHCLLRSSSGSEKRALGAAIKGVFELAGAQVELSGDYDGWLPNMESPILHAMLSSYEQLYGRRPAVMAIHAGLECGIIGGKYEGLDMISFGPTISSPHSPDERVEIASVAKFYEFLLHTLKNAPVKE